MRSTGLGTCEWAAAALGTGFRERSRRLLPEGIRHIHNAHEFDVVEAFDVLDEPLQHAQASTGNDTREIE